MAWELSLEYYRWLLNHNLKTVSRCFDEARVFLYIQLNRLAHVCDKHFGSTTLTSWIISFIFIWVVIYLLYAKVIGVILRRMALPMLHRSRLTESVWNAGFCISCIPFCVTKLLVHTNHVTDMTDIITEKLFITEKGIPTHILFSFIVICAFYVHNICLICIMKGFEAEFFAKGLLVLFLYTSYLLRYTSVGFSAVALFNIPSLCVEFMRICYSLNQGKVVKPGCLRNFTCILFVIHCVLWVGVFLYTLPQYYMLPAINVQVSDENLLSIVMLSITLWSYFWLELFCAPILKFVRYCLWPDYTYGRRDWLDYVLFPPRNDIIQHLKRIRSKARLEQASSFQNDQFQEGKEVENGTNRHRNSVALYQTVKCVMAMKRKIRNKRAAKASASSEQQEVSS